MFLFIARSIRPVKFGSAGTVSAEISIPLCMCKPDFLCPVRPLAVDDHVGSVVAQVVLATLILNNKLLATLILNNKLH